ncbi:transglutaminase-like cysteine peptidase [Brucella sp. IR073]|uniref:transglutaminase-like cysteine peptidase n=1 Tax=unclassified Brucella TaxID=2632610 RepID=UPI003B984F10
MRKYAVAACVAGFLAGAMGMAKANERLSEGGATSIPYGHLDYCKRNPRDCGAHRIMPAVALNGVRWRKLERVNQSVNAAIQPKSDQEVYGKRDYWAIPANRMGDCEDYVLMKRARLLGMGFSASQLLITMVRNRGEAHVVLTVRTDKGDFILDNLRNEILPVEKTGYQYVKMQAPNHSGRWVSISGRAIEVAAN